MDLDARVSELFASLERPPAPDSSKAPVPVVLKAAKNAKEKAVLRSRERKRSRRRSRSGKGHRESPRGSRRKRSSSHDGHDRKRHRRRRSQSRSRGESKPERSNAAASQGFSAAPVAAGFAFYPAVPMVPMGAAWPSGYFGQSSPAATVLAPVTPATTGKSASKATATATTAKAVAMAVAKEVDARLSRQVARPPRPSTAASTPSVRAVPKAALKEALREGWREQAESQDFLNSPGADGDSYAEQSISRSLAVPKSVAAQKVPQREQKPEVQAKPERLVQVERTDRQAARPQSIYSAHVKELQGAHRNSSSKQEMASLPRKRPNADEAASVPLPRKRSAFGAGDVENKEPPEAAPPKQRTVTLPAPPKLPAVNHGVRSPRARAWPIAPVVPKAHSAAKEAGSIVPMRVMPKAYQAPMNWSRPSAPVAAKAKGSAAPGATSRGAAGPGAAAPGAAGREAVSGPKPSVAATKHSSKAASVPVAANRQSSTEKGPAGTRTLTASPVKARQPLKGSASRIAPAASSPSLSSARPSSSSAAPAGKAGAEGEEAPEAFDVWKLL